MRYLHRLLLCFMLSHSAMALADQAQDPGPADAQNDAQDEASADETKVRTEYYDSGKVRAILRVQEDGKVLEVLRHNEQGVPERREQLDQEGRVRFVTHLGAGNKPLSEEAYSETGALQSLKEFDPKNGALKTLKVYGPEKQLQKELAFNNGKPAKGKEYYASGKLRLEHFYDREGKETKYVEYDESGEVLWSVSYNEKHETPQEIDVGDEGEEIEMKPGESSKSDDKE
jgi:antitoxin component YwqK of YwqJK toxin-antitoxin module